MEDIMEENKLRTDSNEEIKNASKKLASTIESNQNPSSNYYIREYDSSYGDFIVVCKDILRLTDKNGKPLSDELIGYYVRKLSLPSGKWCYSQKGMTSISKNCPSTVSRKNNELIELGLLEKYAKRNERGEFDGYLWIVNPTTNKSRWKKDGLPTEIQNVINNNAKSQKPSTDKPKSENLVQYKNIDKYKNKNKKEFNISKEDNSEDIYKYFSKEVDIDNTYNMLHDSTITESFSNNHDSYDKQSNMQSCSDSINHNNIGEKNQPDSKIECKNNKKGRKTKAEQLKETYLTIIQERESDPELKELLSEFFTVYFDTKKRLHELNFNKMLEKLERLSEGDIYKKRFIVRASIENAWSNFYQLNQNDENALIKTKEKAKWNTKEEEDKDYSELWVDENGNPIMF